MWYEWIYVLRGKLRCIYIYTHIYKRKERIVDKLSNWNKERAVHKYSYNLVYKKSMPLISITKCGWYSNNQLSITIHSYQV